jgi:ABC-type phosphate transport system permease subunit
LHNLAFAGALILIGLILTLSLIARYALGSRVHHESQG